MATHVAYGGNDPNQLEQIAKNLPGSLPDEWWDEGQTTALPAPPPVSSADLRKAITSPDVWGSASATTDVADSLALQAASSSQANKLDEEAEIYEDAKDWGWGHDASLKNGRETIQEAERRIIGMYDRSRMEPGFYEQVYLPMKSGEIPFQFFPKWIPPQRLSDARAIRNAMETAIDKSIVGHRALLDPKDYVDDGPNDYDNRVYEFWKKKIHPPEERAPKKKQAPPKKKEEKVATPLKKPRATKAISTKKSSAPSKASPPKASSSSSSSSKRATAPKSSKRFSSKDCVSGWESQVQALYQSMLKKDTSKNKNKYYWIKKEAKEVACRGGRA